jgi:hypothetical protein
MTRVSDHTDECLSYNRFGDGFDCICPSVVTSDNGALTRFAPNDALDQAAALLVRVEQFLAGTVPGDYTNLLDELRVFLGPDRCSLCKRLGQAECRVHREPEEP